MTETRTRATYRDALANPVYRVVFWVRSVAVAADSLRIVALSALIFASTGSAALAAAAFGIGFVPQVFGGFVLGALPDLVRPRLLITAGYAAECVAATALGLLELPVWAGLTLVAAVACLTPVFHGTSGRLMAEALTGDVYILGRSLFQVTAAGAQLVGMAGAGVAVATVGPRAALLATAGCHLLAAVASRVLLPDLPAAGPGPAGVLRRSWRGSMRLLADRKVRLLMLVQWLPSAFVTGAEGLLVPYAAVHHHPAGSAGWGLACVPVGMIVGDLVVARLLAPRTRELLVAPLIVLLGLPLTGFGLGVGPVVAGLLLFVSGCGFAYGLGLQGRFVEVVPQDVRGQAFALMSTGLMTLQGIGPMVFGALAEVIPIRTAIAVAGFAIVAIGGWLTAGLTVYRFGQFTD